MRFRMNIGSAFPERRGSRNAAVNHARISGSDKRQIQHGSCRSNQLDQTGTCEYRVHDSRAASLEFPQSLRVSTPHDFLLRLHTPVLDSISPHSNRIQGPGSCINMSCALPLFRIQSQCDQALSEISWKY